MNSIIGVCFWFWWFSYSLYSTLLNSTQLNSNSNSTQLNPSR